MFGNQLPDPKNYAYMRKIVLAFCLISTLFNLVATITPWYYVAVNYSFITEVPRTSYDFVFTNSYWWSGIIAKSYIKQGLLSEVMDYYRSLDGTFNYLQIGFANTQILLVFIIILIAGSTLSSAASFLFWLHSVLNKDLILTTKQLTKRVSCLLGSIVSAVLALLIFFVGFNAAVSRDFKENPKSLGFLVQIPSSLSSINFFGFRSDNMEPFKVLDQSVAGRGQSFTTYGPLPGYHLAILAVFLNVLSVVFIVVITVRQRKQIEVLRQEERNQVTHFTEDIENVFQ